MPLYAYRCETCGADPEILHAVGAEKTRCGLACQRRDAGAFGQGQVTRRVTAAHVRATRAVPDSPSGPTGVADPEALRARALEHLGGDQVTEKELATARKGGMTVYRKSDAGTFVRDGGDANLPKEIRSPKESS